MWLFTLCCSCQSVILLYDKIKEGAGKNNLRYDENKEMSSVGKKQNKSGRDSSAQVESIHCWIMILCFAIHVSVWKRDKQPFSLQKNNFIDTCWISCSQIGRKSTSVCSLLRKQMLKQPVINIVFFSRTRLLPLAAIIDIFQPQRTTAV